MIETGHSNANISHGLFKTDGTFRTATMQRAFRIIAYAYIGSYCASQCSCTDMKFVINYSNGNLAKAKRLKCQARNVVYVSH